MRRTSHLRAVRTAEVFGRVGLLALWSATGCARDARVVPADFEVPTGVQASVLTDLGLARPVSVVHDPRADVYLVANRGEGAEGAPFITRLSADGRRVQERWITPGPSGDALVEPGGMLLRGDTLVVADVGCIRRFHRTSGEPLAAVCPPGAGVFVAVAEEEGSIWATERRPGAEDARFDVRRFGPDGGSEVVLQGEEIGEPRGIASGPSGVLVADRSGGRIFQVTPGGPRQVLRGRGWRLDGLVFAAGGSFAFTSPDDERVFFVRVSTRGRRGEVFTLLEDIPASGHLGYDTLRDRILIPLTGTNRLALVDMSP